MKNFLKGFIKATGLGDIEADEHWAGFSRPLSDKQRKKIERGGFRSGEIMGEQWNKMFKNANKV